MRFTKKRNASSFSRLRDFQTKHVISCSLARAFHFQRTNFNFEKKQYCTDGRVGTGGLLNETPFAFIRIRSLLPLQADKQSFFPNCQEHVRASFCIKFLQQFTTSNIHNSTAVTPVSDETGTDRNKSQRDLSFQRLPSASSSYNNSQLRTFITRRLLHRFRMKPARIATNPNEIYRFKCFLLHQVLTTTRNFEHSQLDGCYTRFG